MMGGAGGGGSAPQNFLPPGQGTVAGELPGLIGPMRDQSINALSALGGVSPAQWAYPSVLNSASNIINNPYQNQAVAGAGVQSDIFLNNLMPAGFRGANQLEQFGSAAQGDIGNVLGAQNNPAYGRAQNFGDTAGGRLGGAGQAILDTAFDPQRDLYDRTRQQVTDQQNAINSQAGIAGTPYGAGIAGDRASNFNLDWQDRQLGRQATGGQAAASMFGEGLNDILNPARAQTAATFGGASALGSLSGIADRSAAGVQSILGNLASAAPGALGAPYSALNAIQGNNFGALQNEINLGNANYLLPQQTVSNLEQYLGLGQSASQIASQIASTNNQIGATNFGQLASGLGGASQLAFGSHGPFGAGGLLGGGGLGELFGGGGGASDAAQAAADFGGGGELGVGAGLGADNILAQAAPLAFSA